HSFRSKEQHFYANPGRYSTTITLYYQGRIEIETADIHIIALTGSGIKKNVALCDADSVRINGDISADSFLWNNGKTTESIWVKKEGSYRVKSMKEGCYRLDTIHVFKNKASFLGPDTTLCQVKYFMLKATLPGAVYRWQDGST